MTEHSTTSTGTEALAAMFDQARAAGRAAFLPYFPIGYPTYDESLDIIAALAAEGVNGFEIGMPFSDPLADGPTIQAASQRALENGITVARCLEAVRTLRARGVTQPMLMFGYLNPILAYGVERFASDVRAAGADGLIIPDLPPEEGEGVAAACAQAGLALVYFLAPTSNAARIALVGQKATGFVYVVSLTGVTGARRELPADLKNFIARLKAEIAHVPLVLGFGISTAEQAREVAALTDGFIVGSALVQAAGQGGVEAARTLAHVIRQALGA